MHNKPWFTLTILVSFIVAVVTFIAPGQRRPIDYRVVLWLSIPLACVWLVIAVGCVVRFHRKGLWVLIGTPLALYWPVWLIVAGVPACYWHGNCV